MRQFINKYGKIIVAAVLVIVLIIFFTTRTSKPKFPVNMDFYVDEATGAETIHPATDLPPLIGAAGKPTIVQAMKFSCQGGKHPFIGFYRKYDLAAQSKIAELEAANDPKVDAELQGYLVNGLLVRAAAAGSPWVEASSPEGQKIQDIMCKDGQPAVPVYPQ